MLSVSLSVHFSSDKLAKLKTYMQNVLVLFSSSNLILNVYLWSLLMSLPLLHSWPKKQKRTAYFEL